MEQKLILHIVCIIAVPLLVLLSLFTFGFCIPVILDYKDQLDILENKGCEVSNLEYQEWQNRKEGK